MQAKLILKTGTSANVNRVEIIKELRAITGCGLKEGIDLIPTTARAGLVLKVNLLPGKEKERLDYFTIDTGQVPISNTIKSALNDAIEMQRYNLAKDLLDILKRHF